MIIKLETQINLEISILSYKIHFELGNVTIRMKKGF